MTKVKETAMASVSVTKNLSPKMAITVKVSSVLRAQRSVARL